MLLESPYLWHFSHRIMEINLFALTFYVIHSFNVYNVLGKSSDFDGGSQQI